MEERKEILDDINELWTRELLVAKDRKIRTLDILLRVLDTDKKPKLYEIQEEIDEDTLLSDEEKKVLTKARFQRCRYVDLLDEMAKRDLRDAGYAEI